MKTITQREMRNDSARIMDEVERGETFHITRGGTPVAELRPLTARRRFVPTDELVALRANQPPIDHQAMRAEADEVFGDQGDRV